MILRTFSRKIGLLIATIGVSMSAFGESVWVSDEFEITLRTGPSTSNAIVLMVNSGAELEVLERDQESGYTQVRTGGGTEGWVLSRYMMREPGAREQLQRLTQQLASASSQGTSLESQLSTVRGEYQQATQRIAGLERDKATLQTDLEEIRRTAASTLTIDSQNKVLQQELTDAEIKVNVLEQENDDLSDQRMRNWVVTGALILFGGIILGLVLPRIKIKKRSGYERF